MLSSLGEGTRGEQASARQHHALVVPSAKSPAEARQVLRRKLSETSAGKKKKKKKGKQKNNEMQHSDKVSVRRDVEGARARAGCRGGGGGFRKKKRKKEKKKRKKSRNQSKQASKQHLIQTATKAHGLPHR